MRMLQDLDIDQIMQQTDSCRVSSSCVILSFGNATSSFNPQAQTIELCNFHPWSLFLLLFCDTNTILMVLFVTL